MEKTKIDWCNSTWNPVTGCYHDCKYCYAKSIAHRFSGGRENSIDNQTMIIALENKICEDKNGKVEAYPYGFMPTFHKYRLNEYQNKKGRNIFVCSMADLFGEWVPEEWIKDVFEACKIAPQHNYLFLTKNPGRYIELENNKKLPWANNFWFGTSVTSQMDKFTWFTEKKFHWFLSIEPILEDLGEIPVDLPKPEWVIVGAETGNRKNKVIPKKEWIERLVKECRKYNIPIFMKSSLENIWKETLIQEFPHQLLKRG